MLPLGFNSQASMGARPGSGAPAQNGLAAKVHPIGRASGVIGVPGSSRGQTTISTDMESRQKLVSRDEIQSLPSADSDGPAPSPNLLGAIGNDISITRIRRDDQDRTPEVVDPLAGMSESDKWGLKGLRTLMSNYPDFNAMVTGIDPAELGLDLSTTELISTQQWSVFESDPPRPVVNKFRLPECYRVNNVAPLQNKISSFADDTLFYIFYSCTRDLRQQWAAQELFGRNWRWNRKLSIWLTKDDHTSSQNFGTHERGMYIVWDHKLWRRDRVCLSQICHLSASSRVF
jgi:CCR4-NOT transcription complex subunit 2